MTCNTDGAIMIVPWWSHLIVSLALNFLLLTCQGRHAIWGGVDGGTEGPERGAGGAKRWSADGGGSGKGHHSPFPVWGPGGYAPEKKLKNQR